MPPKATSKHSGLKGFNGSKRHSVFKVADSGVKGYKDPESPRTVEKRPLETSPTGYSPPDQKTKMAEKVLENPVEATSVKTLPTASITADEAITARTLPTALVTAITDPAVIAAFGKVISQVWDTKLQDKDNKIMDLEAEVSSLQTQVQELTDKVDALEQYGRRESLRFQTDVPEKRARTLTQ